MTNLRACPVCAAPAPANRITAEPWCCSVDCFRTFHRMAAPGAPDQKEVVAIA
ncbi:MAG: hypothetical protein ACLQU9_18110 [Acidimicrobiales bacterium]|jgi:hypothetical protein